MSTPDSTQHENVYFMDPESSAEMARLINQDRLTTRCMGGLFSEHSTADLASVRRVLDIGCGPGGWVQEVAYAYPKMEVVGIDISQTMISYARTQAQVQRLDNAYFQIMDATKPLNFSDGSFDLVNARFIGFFPKAVWPQFLQECVRITRPGGIIRLTEIETGMCGITNSVALERLNELGTRALYLSGHGFSPDGRHVGTTPLLARFLRDAGYQNVQQRAHVMDYSAQTEAHEGNYQNIMVGFKLFQPFLLRAGETTQEELDQLYEQMLVDMRSADFCGLAYFLTVWGKKP
jgi:ubiquinone/menaquinone biosynthesis C-methylase UbiE